MTRGEALLAMEGGARVRQVWMDGKDGAIFFLNDIDSDIEYQGDVTVNPSWYFLNHPYYELVPEPDTAEKFVRDMAELLKRDPKEKSLFWLCEKATPDTHDYTWRQRFDALIQQMDGEK